LTKIDWVGGWGAGAGCGRGVRDAGGLLVASAQQMRMSSAIRQDFAEI